MTSTVVERRAARKLLSKESDPLERAKLKAVLGQRRTRAETIAFAQSLLAAGRSVYAVADELTRSTKDNDTAGVERYARYLRTVLGEGTQAAKLPRNPSVHAGEMTLSPESDRPLPSKVSGRPGRLRHVPMQRCPGCGIDYVDAFRFDDHLDERGGCPQDDMIDVLARARTAAGPQDHRGARSAFTAAA